MLAGMNDNDTQPVTRLALEDGSVFEGRSFGSSIDTTGEVVFNTAMTGYQEALTDPSYVGQILVMTTPLIGNYGIGPGDVESTGPQVAGFVVRECSRRWSNHRGREGLSDWLRAADVPGLEGIDTRALVRRIRDGGAMRGAMTTDPAVSDTELVKRSRSSPSMVGRNLAETVGPAVPHDWREGLGDWRPVALGDPVAPRFRVVALDCGAKHAIYRHLVDAGCRVEAWPHGAPAAALLEAKPDGLFISNGPGDPAAVTGTIDTLREVAGRIPTFGICLGHQLLALSLGARTYKLPFGHRGANQPVRSLLTGRVEITSQNHGFCVDRASLEALDCEVTHVHLNDGTVAGFRHRTRPILGVQYHPEASPGPHDAGSLFRWFTAMMETGQPVPPLPRSGSGPGEQVTGRGRVAARGGHR